MPLPKDVPQTAEDYWNLPEGVRAELIDGELWDLASPSRKHQEIVSALTTKYRDLAMLVSFGVHLWMYATPVTYSTSMIAEKFPNLLGWYMLNPITPIIELFRAAYLGVPRYSYGYNLLSVIVTIVVFMLGVILFSRTEKTFMDTV